MFCFKNNVKGLTLIEVLTAIGVIGILIFVSINVITQSMVSSKRMDMEYSASNIAQQRMDEVKNLNFDDIPSVREDRTRVDFRGNIDPEGLFLRTTKVYEDYVGNEYLKKIKVSVKRSVYDMTGSAGRPGDGDTFIIESLFADYK